MRQAEREFNALAAQPYLQQIRSWYEQSPLPRATGKGKKTPATEAVPIVSGADGVTRLLRTTPFRDVLLRELLQ